ncbi:MAG: formylglycine-generating enzyme family protein [Fibrobacteria bacterium]|nr:formylglycine-generating enzyme family protein [Fibrobacteria bacterium]
MRIPSLIATLLGVSASHAFLLTGTIHVEGTRVPLPGAAVSIAGRPEIPSSLTDAAGAFALSDQAAGVSKPVAPRFKAVFLGRSLKIDGIGAGDSRLDILSASGRIVATLQGARTGAETVEFRLPRNLQGVSILRLRQGDAFAVWTLVSLQGGAGAMHAGASLLASRGLAAIVDTLVVTKPGMQDLRYPLPEGAGDRVTTLAADLAIPSVSRGRMRFIPEGRFLMGDSLVAEAMPRIHRSVRSFWMDTVVATRADFRASGIASFGADSLPAEGNWMKAVRYCNARSRAEGLPEAYELTADSANWAVAPEAVGYRLPTEAEWEYAARAGTTTGWFWGEDTTAPTMARYAFTYSTAAGNQQPVGLLGANGFGLRDMAGNSWEWTEDRFGPYARDDMQPIPQYLSYGYHRVMRGGAWMSSALEVRSGYRKHDLPLNPAYIGVRCVRTAFPDTARPWRIYPVQGRARRIPGGSFLMGDASLDTARPVSVRRVRNLWADTVHVSGAEWSAVTGFVHYGDSSKPADINWYKAVRYCNARSLRDGLDPVYDLVGDSTLWWSDTTRNGWRLPTEAEWEYLARGGSSSAWWWGSDTSWDVVGSRAWWSGNSFGNSRRDGLRLPNPFGLYDMVGNYWHWTDDFFALYTEDGSRPKPLLVDARYHRVMRGGAWFSSAEQLRSGYRRHEMGLASGYVGFRCVRNAD